jgi:hypothetical protein
VKWILAARIAAALTIVRLIARLVTLEFPAELAVAVALVLGLPLMIATIWMAGRIRDRNMQNVTERSFALIKIKNIMIILVPEGLALTL